ncbi:hypothetical protein SKAU_G00409140 [Synaphobranchus kaupii]|uniref:Uncharacterized protein n=1 Tax=Synaphobranchus kaupii TaxID=118154 RepID=A0A9Q1EAM5_SYNKA|nr:hypothetical protein SKAU_G00409140 [Synaphobranchus kaupii]
MSNKDLTLGTRCHYASHWFPRYPQNHHSGSYKPGRKELADRYRDTVQKGSAPAESQSESPPCEGLQSSAQSLHPPGALTDKRDGSWVMALRKPAGQPREADSRGG